MATTARVSGASVVNAAWRSRAAGTEAMAPVPAAVVLGGGLRPGAGAAASVAVAASGTEAMVGRTGSTAAGLSTREVGSRESGSRPAAVAVLVVSVVSATGTGCATATGVAPIAVPKPATTRTAARAHPVTAVRPIRIRLSRTAPRWSAPRASAPGR